MTHDAFLADLERDLQAQGVPFTRYDLIAFAECCRPLVRRDASPARWVILFLERLAEAGVRVVGSVPFEAQAEKGRDHACRGRC